MPIDREGAHEDEAFSPDNQIDRFHYGDVRAVLAFAAVR